MNILLAIPIGAGATLVMDAWAALLRRFGIPSLDFALLGRWLGHLPRGRFVHHPIAASPAIRGERALGWIAHYAIGVTFAAVLLASFGSWTRHPSLGPALFIGLVTSVMPLFVLQPALGAGIASSKTKTPIRNAVKSLVTHAVYGVGLWLAGLSVAAVAP